MKKLIQLFKEKRLYRYSFIAAAVLVSAAVVYAATVPYTFTSGTVAKSSEVNANFTYLADRSWEKSGSNLYYSSGNVGIGTASPSEKLNIKGASPRLRIDSGTAGGGGASADDARIILKSNTTGSSGRYDIIATTAGDFRIAGFNSSETQIGDFLTITQAGNVGIGTTSPSYPLHMGSGAYVTTGGVWTNASSRTYKEHIAELTSNEAIAAFQGLKAVTYNYKVDKDEKHVGFIAEDVPAILATKDRKGVSPMDVVALLTKVVQEQQKTIAVLAKEVEGLKKGRM